MKCRGWIGLIYSFIPITCKELYRRSTGGGWRWKIGMSTRIGKTRTDTASSNIFYYIQSAFYTFSTRSIWNLQYKFTVRTIPNCPLITLMYVQIWIKSLLQLKPAVRYIFYGRHTNHIVFRSFMYVQNRIKIELIFNRLRNALKFNEKNSSVNLFCVWKLLIFMYSN